MRRIWAVAACCIGVLSGCSGDIGDEEPRCTDPKYGNGTCDIDTTCTSPDIDCFSVFADQAAATTWYESTAKADTSPVVPADPRAAHIRELLDNGWNAYQATHNVGDLSKENIQLVIVNPPSMDLGAFVMGDAPRGTAGLAVMVETKLLDKNLSDEELMGIVMHEIEHALGLHVLAEVKTRIVRFYVAPAGTEPFGFEATDNAQVRSVFTAWKAIAVENGHLSDAQLHGFPFAPAYGGILGDMFRRMIALRAQANPTGCMTGITAFNSLNTLLLSKISRLDGSITVDSATDAMISQVMGGLETGCFMGVTVNPIDFVAQQLGITPAMIRAGMTTALQAAIDGAAPIQAFYSWVSARRADMRAAEMSFQTMTGQPFTQLRYYSTEEAADDSSVTSLDAMGLSSFGVGRALMKLEGIESLCQPLLDSNGAIPYGAQLTDDHHATCWRAGHAKRFAQSEMLTPRILLPMAESAPTVFEQYARAHESPTMN